MSILSANDPNPDQAQVRWYEMDHEYSDKRLQHAHTALEEAAAAIAEYDGDAELAAGIEWVRGLVERLLNGDTMAQLRLEVAAIEEESDERGNGEGDQGSGGPVDPRDRALGGHRARIQLGE